MSNKLRNKRPRAYAQTGIQPNNIISPKVTSNDQAIIAQIIGDFINRSRKEIGDWRQGIDAADYWLNPRWQPLQDLFEYLRPDGHLGSQIGIRKGTVVANKFFIRDGKTGKPNADKTKWLRKKWFKNLVKDLLDNIFLGYTVIQVTDVLNGKYDLIPRRNFIPQLDIVLLQVWQNQGISINDPAIKDSIICIKNQDRFGILNDIVPDLIWKRNARQSWAEFSEKFGMPMVVITTNKTDKKELDRIENMAKSLAEASRAILPEGTTVKLDETAQKGDPYKIYLEQVKYCDQQISKRILGGTMVSDDGSSRSQAEVHERTHNDIIGEDDRTDIEFTINDQLMPMLIKAGIMSDGDEFVYDRSEDLSMKEFWDIVNGLLEHYDIDEDWIGETFNVPIISRKIKEANPIAITKTKKQPTSFFD